MSNTPTPHIGAQKGEIASKVLLPGDPLRAKFIAENYLTDVKCYNEIRNMLGFTGLYKGERVSVQGSGMGVSSVGIYCYELYNFYDVESIIRIGTAGSLVDFVKPRLLILGIVLTVVGGICLADGKWQISAMLFPGAEKASFYLVEGGIVLCLVALAWYMFCWTKARKLYWV